jgi:hypothetical protein
VQDRLVVWELAEARSLGTGVLGGHRERVDAGEHVELGDCQSGEPVEPYGVAERHEVEPAAAPRTTSGRAELPAGLTETVAHLVVELSGEGPGPHTRHVGLGDAPRVVDVLGPDACTHARRPGDRIGRRDEGIGAVVDVEQRALRALEQDEPAAVQRVPDDALGVRDEGLEPVPERAVLLGHRVQVERRILGVGPQGQALRLHGRVDLLLEDLLVEQVLHANAETSRLVRIAGADPTPRRTDLELAELGLAGVVEQQVVGHDQVRVRRDAQPARVHAAVAQLLELGRDHLRVDHHSVADQAELAGVEDPGRHEVELVDLVSAHDRVAGVVAALEADHHVGRLGKQVRDLALPLVAPLGADNHQARHFASESREPRPVADRGP